VTRRLSVAVAAVALGLALAGCAIPTQGSPSSIADSKVPFGLLDPHLPTTTTTQPKPSSLVPVTVFFIGPSQQLQSAARVVAAPAPLTAILESMLAGPTAAETASGLFTAIPNDVTVLSTTSATTAQGNIVTVNLNSAFLQIAGADTPLAVGQVVATIAAENGLGTGVIFEIDGVRTSVPIANGSQATGPVYVLEFLSTPA
jgi:spore germination protein GerM